MQQQASSAGEPGWSWAAPRLQRVRQGGEWEIRRLGLHQHSPRAAEVQQQQQHNHLFTPPSVACLPSCHRPPHLLGTSGGPGWHQQQLRHHHPSAPQQLPHTCRCCGRTGPPAGGGPAGGGRRLLALLPGLPGPRPWEDAPAGRHQRSHQPAAVVVSLGTECSLKSPGPCKPVGRLARRQGQAGIRLGLDW